MVFISTLCSLIESLSLSHAASGIDLLTSSHVVGNFDALFPYLDKVYQCAFVE